MLIEALLLLTRRTGLHLLIWYRVKPLYKWVMRLLLPGRCNMDKSSPDVYCRQDAMQHQSFKTDPEFTEK